MRILMVHNYYQQPGGEDVVYESEAALLEAHGHEVRREEFRNSTIPDDRSILSSVQLAASTIWSRHAQRRLEKAIQEFQPDVAHFHNTFPQVSPAAYHTCRRANVPVIQTLHNYRLLCPSATFYRDGRICEDCLERRLAWPGIAHACYHGSRSTTAAVAAMQTTHRLLGTWNNTIDMYIALSAASRDVFVRGGMQPEAIVVKPNFLAPDPGPGNHTGNFALFVGRLSPEKGIGTLLQAWDHLPGAIPLNIVGDGPLASEVASAASRNPSIEWLGSRPVAEAVEMMGDAALLVFPSEWHEPFGRTIVEAFARGTPVLASNVGAARDLITPGRTGHHFTAGNAEDLANKVTWLFDRPALLHEMGTNARAAFESDYSADENYPMLLGIYRLAIARNMRSAGAPAGHLAG